MDKAYTDNLTDKARIEIGKLLLIHEFKKLFPNLQPLQSEPLKIIEQDITALSEKAQEGDEVGIRDFWNLVDALMMGYKLKNIIPLITSPNIDWEFVKSLEIQNLKFTANITKLDGIDINGKTVKEVIEYFDNHSQDKELILKKTKEYYPNNDTRHLDPVLVIKEENGDFVHDGNGRLMKAIIEGIKVLPAYVGTRNSGTNEDEWVATNYLMRLNQEQKDLTVNELISNILSTSQNAKYEYENRVQGQDEKPEE